MSGTCICFGFFFVLTLPALKPFSSEAQVCIFDARTQTVWKTSKPCQVGLHCIEVLSYEYPYVRGISHLSASFCHFVSVKLATSTIRVKGSKQSSTWSRYRWHSTMKTLHDVTWRNMVHDVTISHLTHCDGIWRHDIFSRWGGWVRFRKPCTTRNNKATAKSLSNGTCFLRLSQNIDTTISSYAMHITSSLSCFQHVRNPLIFHSFAPRENVVCNWEIFGNILQIKWVFTRYLKEICSLVPNLHFSFNIFHIWCSLSYLMPKMQDMFGRCGRGWVQAA